MSTNLTTMPTTYGDIVALIRGRKNDTVTLGNNTTATWDWENDTVTVRLHGHAIVRIHEDDSVDIRHCGCVTATTFDRLRRFVPAGYRVSRKGGMGALTNAYSTRGIYGLEWVTAYPFTNR